MVEPNRLVETIRAVKVESIPQGGFLITMDQRLSAGWNCEFPLGCPPEL